MEPSNTSGPIPTSANVCRIIGCVILGMDFVFHMVHFGNVMLGFFVQLAFGDTGLSGLPDDVTVYIRLLCQFVALLWAVRPRVFARRWRWCVALAVIAVLCFLSPIVVGWLAGESDTESWVIALMAVPIAPAVLTSVLWTIAGLLLRNRADSEGT